MRVIVGTFVRVWTAACDGFVPGPRHYRPSPLCPVGSQRVVDQVFQVDALGLKENMQTPSSVLERLHVYFAYRPVGWDVIADGETVPGNG